MKRTCRMKHLTEISKRLGWSIRWKAVGDDNGCTEYATKEESRIMGPFTWGVLPMKLNNRADWDTIY